MLQLNFLKSLQCEAAAATFENKETFQMHQSVSLTASMPTTPRADWRHGMVDAAWLAQSAVLAPHPSSGWRLGSGETAASPDQ